MADNRDKTKDIDESILDETPPNINEPQGKDDADEKEVTPVADDVEVVDEAADDTIVADEAGEEDQPEQAQDKETPTETAEQKEQRYKAQQTEAQIQAARNRVLTDKVDEAANLPTPTIEELKAFVSEDGGDWDLLSPYEQAVAKRTFLAEKRFAIVNESVQSSKKIDEWAGKVDTFLDENDGKSAYAMLLSHEADFRKYAMKESHRGTPIDVLAAAFLHNLPAPKKTRGSLFERSGGGEKQANPNKITDADTAATLRQTNPREYRRQLKLGNIKVEV